MSRIAATFAQLKAQERKAFIPFVMAGDPSVAATADILIALADNGADIIEIGMPFSDPMADGPVIQAAGLRALEAGVTLADIFALVKQFRATNTTTPIVLMGYANSVYSHGAETFATWCAEAGVDGLIIVDLPAEEAVQLAGLMKKNGVDFIRLIAPTTKGERLAQLVASGSGFLYYISIAGITGSSAATDQSIEPHLTEIRSLTDLPICIGFGIKTQEDVQKFGAMGDGVVVGSALVKALHGAEKPADAAADFLKQLL